MQTAPPVQVVCTGGAVWRAALLVLPVLAAVSFFVWLALHAQLSMLWAVLGVVPAAWLSWTRLPRTGIHLVWDGQVWSADGQRGELRVMLHLGSWLLLRHETTRTPPQARARRWVAAHRSDTAAAHHALCAAVYCRRFSTTPGGSPRQPR